MTGGALLAQVVHAAGESASLRMWPLPNDTRAVVLSATKEQLATLRTALEDNCVSHAAILETDGPMAGVITAIGIVVSNREALKPWLGELKVWR